eukprot:snap_masked-scaffold_3-processed-gene-1.41-mRNA-1 protein AED:0.24 eAED:0.24 QI:0/-1/0/1/-1/1/1/0/170
MARPDVSLIVNRLATFTKKPAIEHIRPAKRVLKYLLCTKTYGILYRKNFNNWTMNVYSDASWKNVTGDKWSLKGYLITLNGGAVSWKIKKQKNISISSTVAELVGLTRALSTAEWIKNVLNFMDVKDLDVNVFTDSLSTVKLIQGQTLSEKPRHMGVKYFFTRKIIIVNN